MGVRVQSTLVFVLLGTLSCSSPIFGRCKQRKKIESCKLRRSRRCKEVQKMAEFSEHRVEVGSIVTPPIPDVCDKHKKKSFCPSRTLAEFFGVVLEDVYQIHRSILHWDSFKIVTSSFPFFVGARMIDEKLQRCFYDSDRHKNINQMPSWVETAAKWSISIPIIFLGMHAFFEKDDNLRETSRVFLVGMPFVIWTKTLIKKLKFESSLRPWHQNFSCKERAGGGFPSGHMAEAAYMATLYGMRFGPKYAIPLGIVAGFIGITFLTGNRHYVSQLVAGASFGALYAVAANKVIDKHLQEECNYTIGMHHDNGPVLSFSYRF